jgi:hypothetical protein
MSFPETTGSGEMYLELYLKESEIPETELMREAMPQCRRSLTSLHDGLAAYNLRDQPSVIDPQAYDHERTPGAREPKQFAVTLPGPALLMVLTPGDGGPRTFLLPSSMEMKSDNCYPLHDPENPNGFTDDNEGEIGWRFTSLMTSQPIVAEGNEKASLVSPTSSSQTTARIAQEYLRQCLGIQRPEVPDEYDYSDW